MDKCMWIAAGYPACGFAIVALWVAYQKAQGTILKERQDTNLVWKQMKKVLREKARGRGR